MFGSDLTMAAMGTILALLGALPAGMALASDRPRMEQSLAGTIGDIRRERPAFTAEDGRSLRVDWEACAAAAVAGERVTLTGRWDGREFEPRTMRRANGETVTCRPGHAAAASAAIGAPEAIAAAARAGYRDVTELEWERGAWQLRALDAQGTPVRLTVDATTGAVVRR